MKKITSILAVLCLFAVVLASCSKNDSSETSSNSLVGTWAMKSVNGQEITDDCEKRSSLVFSPTNLTISVYVNNGLECISETKSYSYTISGDKMILKGNGETATNSIIVLNETTNYLDFYFS